MRRLEKRGTGKRLAGIALAVAALAVFQPGACGAGEKKAKALGKSMPTALDRSKEVTLDLGGGVKMEFVLIPAGTFMMGELPKERGAYKERGKPQHKVTVATGFYLGKHEVTQAQYERIAGKGPSKFKGPNLPVEMINWQECVNFCKKLSEKTGRKVRLPTEAEWEYACRAGSKTRFYFGDKDAGLVDVGWCNENSEDKTHPVGEKPANKFGLYDMHGNVWEWCQSWYGPYKAEEVTDPKGAVSGKHRVMRGGSWRDPPSTCRSAVRGATSPSSRHSFCGLRVALDF